MQDRRRGRIKPHAGWVRATTLHQASVERWKDARALLAADRPHGAVYLAGYVLECALKFVACARMGRTYLEEWEADLGWRRGRHTEMRGRRGHDLEWLLECAGLDRQVSDDDNLRHEFLRVKSWSVDLRYRASTVNADDARRFLGSVEVLRAWLENQILR